MATSNCQAKKHKIQVWIGFGLLVGLFVSVADR